MSRPVSPRPGVLFVFASLAQIQAHGWAGVHAYDAPAFDAVDFFARDSDHHSSADRAEALRSMITRGMGCTIDDDESLGWSDSRLLEAYL
jgi:hypothetical protein